MPKSVVALVGRPNVGKSTLFNRLADERLAVVDEVPGTTRDRLMAEALWSGVHFSIIDTGGIDPTQISQGRSQQPLSIGSADFIDQIKEQAEVAIAQADAILFIVDAESGVTPADHEVAQVLRHHQQDKDGQPYPPIFLVVNKADNEERRSQAYQFYELGIGDPYAISALHGTGTGDLLESLVSSLQQSGEEDDDESVKIAIVGKPNVGKSSLLNQLLGEERAIVSEIPGTTRDAVDTYMSFDETPITLIDTAGIRKRGKIEPGVEKYSVLRTFQAIDRASVVLLLVDATTSLTAQDAHIAGYIIDAWKSVVVVVNKWDAITKDTHTMTEYTRLLRQELNFLPYVPLLFISAKTGQRVSQVLPMALRVQDERLMRLSTSQLNRILQKAQDMHPAPTRAGKPLKIYYGTQVRNDPPIFLLHVNDPELAHFTYQRFLENRIREEYPFLGTPIRLVFRRRS
jgi:GTP-binding protein